MGSPISQVASSTQPQGKGGQSASNMPAQQPGQPQGKGSMPSSVAPPVQQVSAPEDMNQPAGGQNGQPINPQGKGGRITFPQQGGQPQMGKPNAYSNTVGPWDNANIQPQTRSGKGKGY